MLGFKLNHVSKRGPSSGIWCHFFAICGERKLTFFSCSSDYMLLALPSGATWRHRSGSTSHYLNRCWLIIKCILWHSHERYLTRNVHALHIPKLPNNYVGIFIAVSLVRLLWRCTSWAISPGTSMSSMSLISSIRYGLLKLAKFGSSNGLLPESTWTPRHAHTFADYSWGIIKGVLWK